MQKKKPIASDVIGSWQENAERVLQIFSWIAVKWSMKKVVLIAYSFPPVGGGGVQRPTKFVKYLRNFGWEPIVLTVANPSVPLLDESLLKDIPAGVRVYRAHTLEPSYGTKKRYGGVAVGMCAGLKERLKKIIACVLLPDIQVLWWPGLVLQLLQIIRAERPDCLFVTAPPFSSLVPVVILANLFNIPVVIDFRDEWSFSRNHSEHAVKTSMAFWFDRVLEKYVEQRCSALTAANASYIESLCCAYPSLNKSKTRVITNGFDEEDFLNINRAVRYGDTVNMVYAGTVWNGNSLEPFVRALKKLNVIKPTLANRLKVKVYGRVVESQSEYLQDDGIEEIVTLYGYQDHSKVLEEMFSADVLILAMTDLPGAEKIILGKVFEYLATNNHILAIIPDGETKKLLSESSDNVHFVSPEDDDGIVAAFVEIMSRIKVIRNCPDKCHDQFSRKYLTEKLSELLFHVSTVSQ